MHPGQPGARPPARGAPGPGAVRPARRRGAHRRRRRPQRAALPAHRGRLRAAGAGRPGRGDRARQRAGPGPGGRVRSAAISRHCAAVLRETQQIVRYEPRGDAAAWRAAEQRGWRPDDADRPVRHLPGRHDVPGRGQGDRAAAGAARPRGGLPGRADLLRPDAHQHRLPAGGAAAGPPARRTFAPYDVVVAPVRVVRRIGAPPARDGGPVGGRRRAGRPRRGRRVAHLRAVRAARRRARGRGRRRVLPAPGHLPPDLPLAADAAGRRQAAAAAAPRRAGWSWSSCPRPSSAAGSAARSR